MIFIKKNKKTFFLKEENSSKFAIFRDELHSNVFSRGGGKNSLHNGEMEEDDCWNTKEKLFQVSTISTSHVE